MPELATGNDDLYSSVSTCINLLSKSLINEISVIGAANSAFLTAQCECKELGFCGGSRHVEELFRYEGLRPVGN